MSIERRAALSEIRVEGRRLSGVVMRYGDTSRRLTVNASSRDHSALPKWCTSTYSTILSAPWRGCRMVAWSFGVR